MISAAASEQRLEEHHPGCRDEGEGQAVGAGLRFRASGGRGVGQVLSEPVDEGCEFHDATMTSL